jgi:hypothetical protein
MRRCALVLRIHRTTVARKLCFLEKMGRIELRKQLEAYTRVYGKFTDLQFDEMETFEHSLCKPVSIPLIVDAHSRLILGLSACSMPAKGRLTQTALKKYGKRADLRRKALTWVLRAAGDYILPEAEFLSDACPRYPKILKNCYPKAKHRVIRSRRACKTGQGELRTNGFDPFFSLNHTCATLRADNSRLIRRTWNTTKRIPRLEAHLILCAVGHNQRILNKLRRNEQKLAA